MAHGSVGNGASLNGMDFGAMTQDEARSFMNGCFDKMTTASRVYVMGVMLACSTQFPSAAPAHGHTPAPKPVRLRLVQASGGLRG